ncbi:quinone oxidoreductase family protein [Hyphomicrobium sulfonivorans]|uniref:quinone oxidoreductase family protein n=1 Tax=Hyphomicrobium sulfonivorans TaxID=121290 RepID=UPI00156E963C|nr:quinone oxidoreductase [Hyphomicrobium sulfonivorans]MBI1650097.1 quinone oxidoreductase [Hyphomicrobium sulfonivorans]NSL73014.1 quinone oxidoreductase [Hyphomicrobium sulfonivorans]
MAHAIRIHANGGPEVFSWEAIAVGAPGPGEALLDQRAVGLNYIDVYHRMGLYPLASFPAIIGMEGAGVVAAVGPGVTDVAVGARVAYAGVPGAYAEERLIPADRLVKLPDDVSFETAASVMLQGMTARYLLRETYRVSASTVLLFHAAAGGVGLIACQWAKALGATMIGTVGSPEKMELAKAAGCTHVINYRTEDFVTRVRELTGGQGCDVVYDSIGKDTFPASLDCLKPKGLWVSFGNASGPVPPFDIGLLSAKGSLFATRPSVMAYTATRADLLANANELFEMIASGAIRPNISRTYPLRDVAEAHRDLESRSTTGSIVLTV